ncbi:hypothetical protein CVT25_009276 [Psilocybe cyanescens]|uniref:HAT C-terminal dimerisation domain-containing protein n=1 Tax=Psilocybe cyanescens TaxID=93625 RepID=A0A409WWD2_PSICY|nr:hypothetical protein CVT25_009276 [Psilocybe cyanescens]
MAKLNEYYERTSVSDAHIICMALHPKQKFKHFCKHWGKDLFEDAKATVQENFIEQYKQLHAGSGTSSSTKEEVEASSDPSKPWLGEWNLFLQTHKTVPEGMGIANPLLNAHCYPTWTSLARDYLAIMTSSVSSERAFSAAGITISKHRN